MHQKLCLNPSWKVILAAAEDQVSGMKTTMFADEILTPEWKGFFKNMIINDMIYSRILHFL